MIECAFRSDYQNINVVTATRLKLKLHLVHSSNNMVFNEVMSKAASYWMMDQEKEKRRRALVWNFEKVVIIPNHYIFTSDERANRNVHILRDFLNPYYKGVCHIALAQEGHCRPGESHLKCVHIPLHPGRFSIESLSVEVTLCNMVVESGGKNGVIPPDSIT
ncbi:hypothetical protein MTR_1g045760 [Medicago truncatula]|uniref:Uncharacterized protein n=1 Tax=Medicago truncatula TaxID=3880 RepID=G7I6Q8_MEDTR|nr:hypothetical protein MTR_1g045760 [Medicago truncatula]